MGIDIIYETGINCPHCDCRIEDPSILPGDYESRFREARHDTSVCPNCGGEFGIQLSSHTLVDNPPTIMEFNVPYKLKKLGT